MQIAIVNTSTLVSNNDAAKMAAAIEHQVRADFAPAWGRVPVPVGFYTSPHAAPADGHGIALVDTIADAPAGVLGYHTEDARGQWGIVACKPELDAGAQVLTGDWAVSSVLSHEVLELLADPSCSFWASAGRRAYCLEVCDPVEAPTYEVDGVAVSNFVLPAWFDPQGTGPFDHLGLLKAPFSLLKGGYVVYSSQGAEHQEYGDQFPGWRREMKAAVTARTRHRLAQAR